MAVMLKVLNGLAEIIDLLLDYREGYNVPVACNRLNQQELGR